MGEGKGCTVLQVAPPGTHLFPGDRNQQQKGRQESSKDGEQQGEVHRPKECRVWRELRAGSWLLQGKNTQNWE